MNCNHLSSAARYYIEIELKKKVSHKQADRFARERHADKTKEVKI
jgi:hypothetical protein